MNTVYLYTLAAVMVVSLLSLIGAFALMIKRDNLNKIIMFLISLSAGTLLGDSFLHLIPEAAAKNQGLGIWLWLLLGMLTFFILEKIIHWRHCHLPTSAVHPHPVGIMNLVGDGLHNFIDGAVIAGSFLIDFRLGLTTTIAVISHEIPQELGDFAVLLYSGYSKLKALLYNFLTAAFAIAGAILALIIGGRIENFTDFIIPFTAGGFIYIAASDLFPELKKDNEKLLQAFFQLIVITAGIGLMLALKIIYD
ncbi:MAG: ZIP family metal transporter [bacterium]|nr:ZIP family metal transporter [bacterium]